MAADKISVSMSQSILDLVAARTSQSVPELSRSGVIARDLERYYNLLRQSRRNLSWRFSPDELAQIGMMLEDGSASLSFPASVSEIDNYISTQRKLLTDWQRAFPDWNWEEIMSKLESLTPIEVYALVDAFERLSIRDGELDVNDMFKPIRERGEKTW